MILETTTGIGPNRGSTAKSVLSADRPIDEAATDADGDEGENGDEEIETADAASDRRRGL